MKILIVCRSKSNKISPFIMEQVKAINDLGINTEFSLVQGTGFVAYIKGFFQLLNGIKRTNPDVIHAHYGYCGLMSVVQRNIPVVITFHGCDINLPFNRILSFIASKLSCRSIYVNHQMASLNKQSNPIIIPCGIDLNTFYPREQLSSRKEMNLSMEKKYVLFSSSFNNKVKNYRLAKEAISILDFKDVELLELDGYSRKEVSTLLNSVDVALLTSKREGSPQFIKEALACNTPIVAVNVGDVKDRIDNIEGNFLSSMNSYSIANNIAKALAFPNRTNGNKTVRDLDNRIIAEKILNIYFECLNRNQ